MFIHEILSESDGKWHVLENSCQAEELITRKWVEGCADWTDGFDKNQENV